MRKYFLSIVAWVGMIFATSCQESLVEPQIDGTTAFTVQVPNQMGTKAIGEASSVTQLLVDVYPFGVEEPIYQTLGTPTSEGFEVELNLIQDQKYDILFWAQTANGYVNVYGNETDGYSFGSLRNVPMNSIYLNNDNGAAFFHAEKGFVPSGTSTTITLVRPFAQLNLGTTDLSLKPATGDVKLYKSLITVKGVATNFNVYEGLGFGNKDVVYVYGPEVQGQDKQPVAVPTDPKTFTIGEGTATQTFNYVSMNYLAVLGDTKAVVDVDAKIIVEDPAINGEKRTIEHSFKSVPVQENYRTNIVGNLISSTTDFNVVVDERFVDADEDGISDDNNNWVVENTAAAQTALDNAKSGDVIRLVPGVDYGTLLIRPVEGKENTITGCDYLVYRNEMLRKVQNLTIIGASGATVDAIKVVAGYVENSGAVANKPDNLVSIVTNNNILLTENNTSKLNIT